MLTQALVCAHDAAGWLRPVGGRPFLEYVLWNLRRHGITDILLGHDAGETGLRDHFGDGSRFGLRLRAVVAPSAPVPTLLAAADALHATFLVIDGARLLDCNYLDLALRLRRPRTVAAVALRPVDPLPDQPTVVLRDGRVLHQRPGGSTGPELVSAGIWAMTRAAIGGLSPAAPDLLPALATGGALAGGVYGGFFLDMATPGDAARSNVLVPAWQRKPAVFFDRDGVLNFDSGFVDAPDRWDWIAGAREAVKRCNDLGYLVLVVTNQSGIGRGYFPETRFWDLMAWCDEQLREVGAHIDAVYHCPHHPEAAVAAYRKVCDCRKPGPGLLDQAIRDWSLDLDRSVFIGDSARDLEAARARGIAARLFTGSNLLRFVESLPEITGENRPPTGHP